jgi:hypothetical protein
MKGDYRYMLDTIPMGDELVSSLDVPIPCEQLAARA